MYHIVIHVKGTSNALSFAHSVTGARDMETLQRDTQPRGVRLQHVLHGEVQDLLDQFARALIAGDGEAVAALWETPAIAIGADGVHAVSSRQEVAEFFGKGKAQYN